jgi:tetratricopeptide (TPR) repeat protein
MRFIPALLLSAAVLSGCAAGADRKAARAVDKGRLDEAIELLEERSALAPEDGVVLRDLGIVYLDSGRFDKAIARLGKAGRISPEERSVPLLLGLAHEGKGEWAGALESYRSYRTEDRSPAVGRTVRGRMAQLVRLVYADRAAALLESPVEQRPGLFVVRYFDVLADADTYGNLGKAITELLVSDFSRLEGFAVVPRLSFEALRQAVSRSRAAGRDPLAVASLDVMLGAGWSLGGTILPKEETDEIRIDYFLVNNATGEVSPPMSLGGSLADFIGLEKRIVFEVLERLGVALDNEEREAIGANPTTHFRAFLAYGNALEAEDRGNLVEARAHYGQALRLDPRFALAAERLERTMGSPEAIRSIAAAEIALPREIEIRKRIERSAAMLLPAPLPERGDASDLSNVRPSAGAELLIRVDRP